MRRALLLVFAVAFLASAQELPDFHKFGCNEALQKKLQEWGALDTWQRAPTLSASEVQFLSPTRNFGVWVSVQYSLHDFQNLVLSLKSNLETIQISFEKECKLDQIKLPALARDENKVFTDAKLFKYMSENKKGVIYVWHPGYVYSQKFKEHFEKVARRKGYAFTTLVPDSIEPDEIKNILKKYSFATPQLQEASIELSYRAFSNHYPRVYVFRNQVLARVPIYGVMNEEQFEKRLDEKEKTL